MPTSTLVDEFTARFAGSRIKHEQACAVLPGGLSHDGRRMHPFPIYVDRALGARKWDVDGHELICYAMGHGSLLLGHSHPAIVQAVAEQAGRGLHFGAEHPLAIDWAAQIIRMVPSAERVRFTSSGTEASLLALQLARAATGRDKILKFARHFHGWHDVAQMGVGLPAERPAVGSSRHTRGGVVLAPLNDVAFAERVLAADPDIAAVILEPSGAGWGGVPLPPGTLERLRAATGQHGALLIFDEVVTGFRWAPGGVQELCGVLPDLTVLGKIVAGGMPGGAVVGRAAVMDLLEFRDDPAWRKVDHPGTHNAHPVSAAAGLTCLRLVADGAAQRQADATASRLRVGFNHIMRRLGVPGVAYGQSSGFHLILGTAPPRLPDGDLRDPGLDPLTRGRDIPATLYTPLHCGMLLAGVHLHAGRGLLSIAHDDHDVEQTLAAFEATLRRMQGERLL
jgi:glutamate-1-semialdehyde 2,1-aminomutase